MSATKRKKTKGEKNLCLTHCPYNICGSIQIKNGSFWLNAPTPSCLPLLISFYLLDQLFLSLTPKRCLCVGLKGLNVSAFMEPDHRRLFLTLFTALHPFGQESFTLRPSPSPYISPFFNLLHSPLLSFCPPPTSQSLCDRIWMHFASW